MIAKPKLTAEQVADNLERRATVFSQTDRDVYSEGRSDAYRHAASIVRENLVSRWQGEPTEPGLYWVEFEPDYSGYQHDITIPIRLYKSRPEAAWYMSDPDTVYDEPLKGRRVAPVAGMPSCAEQKCGDA